MEFFIAVNLSLIIKRTSIIIILMLISTTSFSQSFKKMGVQLGVAYNSSLPTMHSSAGGGLYFEPNIWFKEKIRIGFRIEPTLLRYGIGLNDCINPQEGANFLLNHYLKTDYVLNKISKKINPYIGFSINVQSQIRHETRQWNGYALRDKNLLARFGFGSRFGFLVNKWDFSFAFNKTDNDFRNFVGFNVGYLISRMSK